jgi:hypothetical protein
LPAPSFPTWLDARCRVVLGQVLRFWSQLRTSLLCWCWGFPMVFVHLRIFRTLSVVQWRKRT